MKAVTTFPVPDPDVDVVLPCLNEAGALPWVLSRIPPGWRALVVDNGSTDGSAELARALGATVVREERRGFGAACHAGLTAATADIVCFCDCDGSLDPALLLPFVAEVRAAESDLVLGRRRPQERGAWPAHARAGNIALARMLRRRTGLRLHDLGPLRAARREALLGLGLTDRRSGYPLQMVVRAADAGWRVAEHDVPYLARTGVSKVTGTWRGTWHAVRDMRRVLAEPPTPARVHDLVPSSGGARISARPEARPAAQPEVPTGVPAGGAQVTAPPSAPAPAPSRGGTVQ
ncbi:glycosyltransferase family 2 protein [Streptomyces sp. DT193]|uniref:glycosyltransferase family 2 protein n=1 Tax=Streptomyces sp. DT193 TaxID=3393418 RepID=UPI003CF2FF6F